MANTQQVNAETIRTLAGSSITMSYLAVGTPTIYTTRILSLVNNSDGDVFFSMDGTNNQFFLPTKSYKIFDLCANRLSTDDRWGIPSNTQFYVKQSSTTSSGAVFIELLYGINTVQYKDGGS